MSNYEYKCGTCGAKGVKLWRSYSMFLRDGDFRCVDCACIESDDKHDASSVREDGSRISYTMIIGNETQFGRTVVARFSGDVKPESIAKGYELKQEESDQLGWYVPAIAIDGRANPERPEGYWGYASYNDDRKDDWDYWIELPLRVKAEVPA